MLRLLLVVVAVSGLLCFGSFAAGQEEFDPFDPTDDDAQTGIAVGEKIPPFTAVDQYGKTRSFDDLKGPNGAVLVFHRSADW